MELTMGLFIEFLMAVLAAVIIEIVKIFLDKRNLERPCQNVLASLERPLA